MRGAPSAETHGRAAARHAPPPRPHRCHDATSLVPSTISCRRLFVRQTQLALALSTLVLVSDLCGQAPLDAAVRTLKPGQTVRIRAHGGDRIESRILSVRADSAALSLEGASTPLDGAAIDSLWVRGRATGTGAIIGAAVLGIASIPVGQALCGGLSESASSCGGSDVTVPSFLVGAAGGALIGAAIGAGIPKWRLRYARAAPVQGALRRLRQGRLGLGIAYTVGW